MGKITSNTFNKGSRIRKTGKGYAGYDNPRENIDPHLKTKALDTKEIIQNGIPYSFSDYVKKSGDTMTGALSVARINPGALGVKPDDLVLFDTWIGSGTEDGAKLIIDHPKEKTGELYIDQYGRFIMNSPADSIKLIGYEGVAFESIVFLDETMYCTGWKIKIDPNRNATDVGRVEFQLTANRMIYFQYDETAALENIIEFVDLPIRTTGAIKCGTDLNTEQLIVKADSSQTDNIMEIQDSAGTALAGADERGIIFSDGGTNGSNTFLGSDAGNSTNTGSHNSTIGGNTLKNLTTGSENIIVGANAGQNLTTGGQNVAVGSSALRIVKGGGYSVAIGYRAGGAGVTGVAGGSQNVAIGGNARGLHTLGGRNISIGYGAAYRQTISSDLLIVDNRQRADQATEITNPILYGVMAAAAADQTLRINGELSLSAKPLLLINDARITNDMYISASGVKAPGAKPATFVEYGICGAWRFADQAVAANQESVSGTLKLPTQMDKSVAPVFKVGWSANGVSPGNAEWQLEYLYRSPNEDTTAAAQATITITSTASATSDGLIIGAFAALDLPSSTDQAMFFRLTRLSAGGNDTIADDIELRGMLFTHTRDKLGDGV